jgi:hypothetical protein
MLLRLRGCAAAQVGDTCLARERLLEAATAAQRSGHLFEHALAAQVLGQILPGDDGAVHHAVAADLLNRLGVVRTPNVPLLRVAATA